MPGQMMGQKPHRGVLILVLGILGIVLCFICGIFAVLFANADQKEMEAGTMDPQGMQLTKVGKICGIVGIVLQALLIIFWVLMFILGIIAGAASAGRP